MLTFKPLDEQQLGRYLRFLTKTLFKSDNLFYLKHGIKNPELKYWKIRISHLFLIWQTFTGH